MAHRLAIGFVVDFVKYADRLREEFINSGVYLKDGCILIGNYLRVTGVRIVEFPTLEVYTEKLYNLSDSDLTDLGLGVLSDAKDCYIYGFWDKHSYHTFVNFVIRDYSSKKLIIANEKFISIGFVELENGDLLFNCGQYGFNIGHIEKIYLGDTNKDTDGNFIALDLENSFLPIIINKPMLTDLLGERGLDFCYAFGKGFYLALGNCIVWTNIVGDSLMHKGNVLADCFWKCIIDYSIDLFDELQCLFDVTENLINIDDVSITCLGDKNKELILPSGCKYLVCSNREDGLSNYSNVVFSPNISSIVLDCLIANLFDLGKHGDKKKYSHCTFYFRSDTSVNFFVDILFSQFLDKYIYNKHEKEKQIECYTDFREVKLFGKIFKTTMTEEEFEVSRSDLLNGIETAKDFVKRFEKILPVKIELY